MVKLDLTEELRSITRRIPDIKFIAFTESTILFLILLSFLVPETFEFAVYTILIFLVTITIVIYLTVFFLSENQVDKIGFMAGILLLSGLSLTVVQIEWLYVFGEFEIIIFMLLVSTIATVAVSLFLINKKLGHLDRRSLLTMTWIFSLLLILYFPLALEYTPFFVRERVNFMVLFMAISVSLVSSILLIVNHTMAQELARYTDAGDMRRLLGDNKGAEINYLKAMEVGTSQKEVHTRLADLYFFQGYHENALSHYNRSLDAYGDRNYRLAAISASNLGLYASGVHLIRQGLLAKTSPANWYLLGRMFQGTGDRSLEPDCYREALALDENFWPAYMGLGDCTEGDPTFLYKTALSKGGYDTSKRTLLKKIKGARGFAAMFIHPADIYFWDKCETGPEVMKNLTEFIIESTDISGPDIWEAFTEFYQGTVDSSELLKDNREPDGILFRSLLRAIDGVEDADEGLSSLKNTDRQDLAQYAWGLISALKGDFRGGLKHLNSVESISVRPRAYAAKGCIYYKMGELREAKRNWRTSLSLGYHGDDLLESLSQVARELGEPEQCSYFLRTVLSYPDIIISDQEDISLISKLERVSSGKKVELDTITKNPLFVGTAKFKAGEYNDGESIFLSLLRHNRNDLNALLGYGLCLLGKRKFQEAFNEFQRCIEINQEDPIFYFYRGISLFRMNKRKEALADFKRVAIDRPDWDRNNHYISVCVSSKN